MPARLPDQRPSAATRGYDSRWQRYRVRYLRDHPLCVACLRAGRTTPANTLDHISAHRGNHASFWNPKNHQGLCATCHSGDKQAQEKSGVSGYRGCDVDGSPLDPHHRWNG